jgi:hypothetical protein
MTARFGRNNRLIFRGCSPLTGSGRWRRNIRMDQDPALQGCPSE